MNNLDLAAIIRCLETMADSNSWFRSDDVDYAHTLIDAIEANPWEVAEAALQRIKQANEIIEQVASMGAFSLFDACLFCGKAMLEHDENCAYVLAQRIEENHES